MSRPHSVVSCVVALALLVPFCDVVAIGRRAATMKVASRQSRRKKWLKQFAACSTTKSFDSRPAAKPFFEFWFRKQLPLAKTPAGGTLALDTMPKARCLASCGSLESGAISATKTFRPAFTSCASAFSPRTAITRASRPPERLLCLIPAKQDTKLEPVPHKDVLKAAATHQRREASEQSQSAARRRHQRGIPSPGGTQRRQPQSGASEASRAARRLGREDHSHFRARLRRDRPNLIAGAN